MAAGEGWALTPELRLTRRVDDDPSNGGVTVLPVGEGVPLPRALRPAADSAHFSGRAGEAALAFGPDGRVLLLGLGDQSDGAGRAAGALAAARLSAPGSAVRRMAIDARGLAPSLSVALAEGAAMRAWRPPQRRTVPCPDAPGLTSVGLASVGLASVGLAAIDLVVDDLATARPVWHRARAGLLGLTMARDLVAEPSNSLTPAMFARRLRRLAAHGLTVEVLRPRDLPESDFGLLRAVGRASAHKPRMVVIGWPGDGPAAVATPPLVMIGKGVTFDTGGVCIKPAAGMWEMRADMAGAAACAGAMLTLALRRSASPAVAVLPLVENATGAESYRPGDVLRSVSGRTVEVVDTDAEGRLILADALGYAVGRFGAVSGLVTIATLTGAIVSALGHERAGLFASDEVLSGVVATAAEAEGENVWRMPIGARHREDLDSAIADLRHCVSGRGQPDACHAAAFLREFAEGRPWVHLDIAGVESRENASDAQAAGATGFGARLLAATAERMGDRFR